MSDAEKAIYEIIASAGRESVKLYKQMLADILTTARDKIFDREAVIGGKEDPYKAGQVDAIDYVLRILGYKPFDAETGEEAGIKDD